VLLMRDGVVRKTRRHARPLLPAALASVPYGLVLARVRVLDGTRSCTLAVPGATADSGD